MDIYLVTEEILSLPNIELILKNHFEKTNCKYTLGTLIVSQINANTYVVSGINCDKYNDFYIKIAKGSSSFVDVLVYESENETQLLNKVPTSAWEITKNHPRESGNMTSQRLIKFVHIRNLWGDKVDCKYMIDYHKDIQDSEVNSANEKSMACLAAMNVEIIFSNLSSSQHRVYTPKIKINKLSDLMHKGSCNKIYRYNKKIYLKTNLWNNKKRKRGENDPNKGWLGAQVFLLRKYGYTGEIILKSNRPLEYFTENDNKLTKTLHKQKVSVTYGNEKYIMNKDSPVEDYWKPEETGEKLSSISQHYKWETNGHEVVFSNHAGCEKSFVKSLKGDYSQHSKGNGIPDLVFVNKRKNTLTVIEAEKYINYDLGLKQLTSKNMKEFIRKEFKSYKGFKVESYLTTYSKHDNREHVIYSLSESGVINENNTNPVFSFTI